MAMASAGKYLLSVLLFSIAFCCFIGMAHRKESRLDWLILTGLFTAAFMTSAFSFAFDLFEEGKMIFSLGNASTEGAALLLSLTVLFIAIVPASICFLKASRLLAISYFKTGSIVRAGYAFSNEISNGLFRLSNFTRRVRSLDFIIKSHA